MRKLQEKKPAALVCGVLEDGGRILFLLRKDGTGVARLELPSVEVSSQSNQVSELSGEFKRQTGIDGEVHEILFQSLYNTGSRKRKYKIPVFLFKVTAKNRTARVANEFSGFKWLSVDDARKQKLGRKLEWLRNETVR